MKLLEARDIVKQFSNHLALNKVSLAVNEGSIYGLLGPNGAGKTTLIRIINQITAPDNGEIFFNNHKLEANDVFEIGYLPEERGLYRKMKVGEQAIYLAQLKGLSRSDAISRLKNWFEKFEIQAWWDKKVEELSKGMQQKIQFITTVIHEPKLLIFDEPFSGFDPINANIIKQEILELKKKGATIIFSTHNMESVEELCTHITLINESVSLLEGPMDTIRRNYSLDEYEIGFRGDINLLKATLTTQYKIIENKQKNGDNFVRVRLLNDISTNNLLNAMLSSGNIISFNEIIPSMNDVFIKVVEDASKKNK
ncbi:MAG: ATP-binding cassette domain-containing protein [Bacteroidales bacterium]|nr:ATP-binding cassette domain-containing protein [Bacteroidales bacterium]